MPFPPGDITLLDDFSRADGDPATGRPDLWGTVDRQGAASQLRIVGGQLTVAAHGGGTTLESVADFIRILKVAVLGGGFGVTFGYRLTSIGASTNGYIWSMFGGTFHLYRIDAGATTEVGSGAVSGGLSANTRLAVRAVGGTHELYIGSLLSFPDTPVLSFTDSTYTGAGAFSIDLDSSSWALDDYSAADLTGPTSPVTIIVDPDHAASSDSYSRTQASNASTPMRTVQAAGWLARATPSWADTILVKRCLTTDLGDAKDPQIQPALDYRSVDRSPNPPGWPAGANAGNQPITLKGDDSATSGSRTGTAGGAPRAHYDDLPKILAFNQRGLNNWIIQDLQFGYDEGSGDDHNTFSVVERATDITWRGCLFTGGLAWVRMWNGGFTVDGCYTRSPYPPVESGVHDGSGLRFDASPAEGAGFGIGQLLVQDSTFEFVRGDDALSVGGLDDRTDPLWSAFDMLVQRCTFQNINDDAAYHTDSIQVVSIPRCVVDRCVFISSNTALIASDGRHGYIQFTRNLTTVADTPLQLEGVDELLIAHNTFNHADSAIKDASILFADRAVLPVRTIATIRNNIIGGFFMPNAPVNSYFGPGTVIDHNLYTSNPGLVTAWGTQLAGIPEFGHSTRLDVIPNFSTVLGRATDRDWELANSPSNSPGIGEGIAITGLTEDLFGRAYASPPDVGCFQSTAGTLVTPVARPPYVIAHFPASGAVGISALTDVTATLYPVPGLTIDPATVTGATVRLHDPANNQLPATIALDEPTGVVTLDVDGELYPYVVYTAVIDNAITDTDGNALAQTLIWTFRVAGTGTAVYPVGGAPGGGGSGEWIVSSA